jgi:hypothetical protein
MLAPCRRRGATAVRSFWRSWHACQAGSEPCRCARAKEGWPAYCGAGHALGCGCLAFGPPALAPPPLHWQGPCRLLLIDGIGAFSWQDRASQPAPAAAPARPAAAPIAATHRSAAGAADGRQADPPSGAAGGEGAAGQRAAAGDTAARGASPPLTLLRVHSAVAALVAYLSRQLKLAVVATRQAPVTVAEEGGAWLVQRDNLPRPWQVGPGAEGRCAWGPGG